MRVLVACEESQTVCKAFRARGHEAYSCDIQVCSGGHPEWHIQGNAINAAYNMGPWNLMIAHPECKHLCWSGERWFSEGKKDLSLRLDAFEFFKSLYNAPIEKKCIENSLSWFLRRNFMWETQTVHPYHFGSPFVKSISLWLVGLKPLMPDNIVFRRQHAVHNNLRKSKDRAKTDPNVARAMAEQWG